MKKARKTSTGGTNLHCNKTVLTIDRNYGAMALKYDLFLSAGPNIGWNGMKKLGSAGLEDRRGRRIGSKPSRTPEEELRDRYRRAGT